MKVVDERARQDSKHGMESCASPLVSDDKRLAILGEEFGEVCRAMTYDEGDEANLLDELVQVAAVCLAWAESREATTELGPDGDGAVRYA